MTVDIERFIGSEEAFAVRFVRGDLPGWMSKKLEVTAGHLALVEHEGQSSVLSGPAETNEVEQGLIVKSELRCEFAVDGGRSKDSLPFSVTLGLVLKPRDKTIDLKQLEQSLMKDGAASRSEVAGHFEPYVRDAVRFFVADREASDLATNDQRAGLDAHLRRELQKALFETGLDLADLLHPEFSSDEFDARRRADAHADAQAAAIAREKEVLELKKQLEGKALLADIEIRDQADRTRKEKRLERYEQIRTSMGDDDLKALVMMIEDDKQRSVLIRELIEKDMSPDQKAGLQVSEMESRVEERLIELQQKLAQLTGAELSSKETDPITRRVLTVVGKRILSFDPKTNLHPEVPKEVYDTEDGGLGYLRSVRSERIGGEDYLLVGAQRGCYQINGDIRKEFSFPSEPRGKGGTNSVAYFDGRLYATHSEVGLVEWPLDGGAARILCQDYLGGIGSVRGATILEGHLYFSAGAEIFSLDVATGSEKPVRFKGSDDSITSFAVRRGEVVAGNRSGKLYRWSTDDPNSPEAFNIKKKNPIFMLRQTQIAGQGFFIIGSKDFTVSVAEPRKDLFREYQAREEVRWVDGAGDFIFGVSRSGYKVFCWDTMRQTEPKLTIRVSDKVQDLFVVKELPQKA